MKMPFANTPMQLVGWSAVGFLVTLACFSVVGFLHKLPSGVGFVAFLLTVAIGTALGMAGPGRLKEGMRKEWWTEEQVAHVRTLLEHPAVTWIQSLAWLTFAASIFLSYHSPIRIAMWPMYFLTITLGQFRIAVRSPVERSSASPWLNAAPIQSAHWGDGRL
jgi:hypothetical protein